MILHIKKGLILKGSRIVIPEKLRKKVLNIAHETHQGITKTKMLLRTKVWWPNIEQDVENLIKSCVPCLSVSNMEKPEPLKSTKMPGIWEQVHIDLYGPMPSGEYIL